MRKNLYTNLCLLVLILSFSCSKTESSNDFVGTWDLTSWSIDANFNSDSSNSRSDNLLTLIHCTNNESLVIDSLGTVMTNDTFSPTFKLISSESSDYQMTVECAEGSVGFATSYSQINDNSLIVNGITYNMQGNQLSAIFENAIPIYDLEGAYKIGAKDLKVVYTKR